MFVFSEHRYLYALCKNWPLTIYFLFIMKNRTRSTQ